MPRHRRTVGRGTAPANLVAVATLVACLGFLGLVAAADVHHREAEVGRATLAGAVVAAPSPTEDPALLVVPKGVPADLLVEPPPAVPAPVATTAPTSAPPPTAPPAPLVALAQPVRVVFLGDSVAKTTAAALQPLSGAYGISVDNQGILGCGVVRSAPFRYFGQRYDAVPPGCDAWPTTWRGAVEQDHPEVAVVLVGRWELMDRVVDGRWSSLGAPAFDADVAASLDTAVAAAAATGGRVVLATTPYYRRGPRPDGGTWPEDEPARVDRFNALLREAAARHPGVAVLELGSRLSVDGHLAMAIDGVRVRTDGVHVAPEAGTVLAPWLLPQLRTIAGR